MLDGMFSFVLLDTRDKSFIAAWDAIGITPLYMGWGLDAPPFKCLQLSFLDNEFWSSGVEQ
ncbi:Asparagine synthetase [Sarracenia purpurea var. burkii]